MPRLVLATGSRPFVPLVRGLTIGTPGIYLYRAPSRGRRSSKQGMMAKRMGNKAKTMENVRSGRSLGPFRGTIEDMEAILARASGCRRAAVIGGGLLGLEASKALMDLQLQAALGGRWAPFRLRFGAFSLRFQGFRGRLGRCRSWRRRPT